MKRLLLAHKKKMVALLVLMAGGLLPVYSQEIQTFHKTEAAQAAELVVSERSAVSGSETISSRFALIAGETPAVPGEGGASQGTNASQTPSTSPTPNTAQTPSALATPAPSPATSAAFVFPTRRERFNRYVKSTVGLQSLGFAAVFAGINQWKDQPEEWEQGMSGYGKRFASGFGRNAIQQTIVYGLDSALGLDTGFRRSLHKGFFPRMKDALIENVTSRTRTGKRVISVPRLTGAYVSTVIAAETWYPERYSYKDGLRNANYLLLTGFGMNLIREFVVKF